MTDANPSPATESLPPAIPMADVGPQIQSAARWFWWIAGLSAVNTVMSLMGSDTNFVLGLGFTALVDAIFANLRIVGVGINLLAIGFFFAMGWLGRRGALWAFVLGMVMYTLDGLIYLLLGDMMPVAFHALALYFLGVGAFQLRQSRRAA